MIAGVKAPHEIIRPARPRDARRLAAAILLLAFARGALAQAPSRPAQYVNDEANLLSANDRRALDGYLAELEQKTGAQLLVLTIDSTNGKPINRFATDTYNQWRLGQKGKDNGALLVVAVKDRKYFINTGYGMESVLTDAFCGQVGRQLLVPNFKRGDYSAGIRAATLALANRVADKANATITGMPKQRVARRSSSDKSKKAFGVVCMMVFIIMIVLSAVARSARGRYRVGGGLPWWAWLLIGNQLGHRHRSGWGGHSGWGGGSSWGGSGGWGGGGGFGGFGGGGGGFSGGGGAGGGW